VNYVPVCTNFAKLISVTYGIHYWAGGTCYLFLVKLRNIRAVYKHVAPISSSDTDRN